MKNKSIRALCILVLALIVGIVLRNVLPDKSITAYDNFFSDMDEDYFSVILSVLFMPILVIKLPQAFAKVKDAKMEGKKFLRLFGTFGGVIVIAALIGMVISLVFNLANLKYPHGAAEKAYEKQALPYIYHSIIESPYSGIKEDGTMIHYIIVLIIVAVCTYLIIKNARAKKIFDVLNNVLDKVLAVLTELYPLIGALYILDACLTFEMTKNANVFRYLLATYIGIVLVFIVHMIIIKKVGVSPLAYLKHFAVIIMYAFFTQESAAAFPYVSERMEKFGVSREIANMSPSLGMMIGQAGCTGFYASMVVTTVVNMQPGQSIFNPWWFVTVLFMVVLNSFLIGAYGGGGGGAIVMTLGMLGLPITFLAGVTTVAMTIDKARTALNINGAIVAGIVADADTNK
jgi:L-cystine uptake protein TcyP (sodium:dicarboxylate symporter family)